MVTCKYCHEIGKHNPGVFIDRRRVSTAEHDLSVEIVCHSWQCEKCGVTWTDLADLPDGVFDMQYLDDRDFVVTGIHKSGELENDE